MHDTADLCCTTLCVCLPKLTHWQKKNRIPSLRKNKKPRKDVWIRKYNKSALETADSCSHNLMTEGKGKIT